MLSEASHSLTRFLSVHLLQLNNERKGLFRQYWNKTDNIWQEDPAFSLLIFLWLYSPVINAVPSKFHLPAKTAPLWASTLFSIRPFLETRWNFPTDRGEKWIISRAIFSLPIRYWYFSLEHQLIPIYPHAKNDHLHQVIIFKNNSEQPLYRHLLCWSLSHSHLLVVRDFKLKYSNMYFFWADIRSISDVKV